MHAQVYRHFEAFIFRNQLQQVGGAAINVAPFPGQGDTPARQAARRAQYIAANQMTQGNTYADAVAASLAAAALRRAPPRAAAAAGRRY